MDLLNYLRDIHHWPARNVAVFGIAAGSILLLHPVLDWPPLDKLVENWGHLILALLVFSVAHFVVVAGITPLIDRHKEMRQKTRSQRYWGRVIKCLRSDERAILREFYLRRKVNVSLPCSDATASLVKKALISFDLPSKLSDRDKLRTGKLNAFANGSILLKHLVPAEFVVTHEDGTYTLTKVGFKWVNENRPASLAHSTIPIDENDPPLWLGRGEFG